MKNIIKILIVVFIAALNCYTSCKDLEDPCDESSLDYTHEVEYNAYGYLQFIDPQGNNVSHNYVGTSCKVTFNKLYCDLSKSSVFEYNYLTLADGTLDKQVIGTIVFDISNYQDKFEMYFFVELNDGSSAVGPSLVTSRYFVNAHGDGYICNPIIKATVQVDESGNPDWNSIGGGWSFTQQ